MSEQEREVHPTWFLAFRFWWAFTWRVLVFNAVVASVYTITLKGFGGKNDILDAVLVTTFGFLFLSLEIWLMRGMLSKRFGPYRVTVLAVKPSPE